MRSCTSGRTATPPAGYHTPIDDDEEDHPDDDRTDDEEEQLEDDLAPLTPRGGSLLQPPSPSSALMTVSLGDFNEMDFNWITGHDYLFFGGYRF